VLRRSVSLPLLSTANSDSTWPFTARADLLPQDVGVAAVLRELPEHVEIDPAHRQRSSTIPRNDVVDTQLSCNGARCIADFSVPRSHGLDGVARVELEGLVRPGRAPDVGAGTPRDRLVEPHQLDKRGVLHQPEQGRLGRNEAEAGLFFTDAIEAVVECSPVVVQKRLELIPERSRKGGRIMGSG
jgi:hypothetical protein